MTIQVVKRDGRKEHLDIERIHKVLTWACEGLTGVSVSAIEMASKLKFINNISTKDIHETLIKAAAELITEDTPNYQHVAGRLINYRLRKEVYGKYQPDTLLDHYCKVREIGYYDTEIWNAYTLDEWDQLNEYIDHSRDDDIAYAGMEQYRTKYLVKNRVTGEIYETPQMALMLMAMTLFSRYEKDRLYWVKRLYDSSSKFDVSLPTPIMAAVRTPQRQFSSCTLIDGGDSLKSINAAASAIVGYASNKAGIGINSRIRAEGDNVRKGDTKHTGSLPFWKYWAGGVHSCSQGGVRKGSATLNWVGWHKDFETLIPLKSVTGTEETRLRTIDYCVHFNKLMYERFLQRGNITLFSPADVPGLYEAFYADQDEFRRLYEKYEKDSKIPKKTIPAGELFSQFLQHRKETGRVYLMNVDHANTHGGYDPRYAPIYMTNLCTEILQHTKPMLSVDNPDDEGLIALCTLAAINMGKIKKPSDFKGPAEVLVRALNALLDYQDYPVEAARRHTMRYRPLGIGIIDYAHWLAKNGTNYSNTNLELVHEYAESFAYYLISASVDMAEEFGPCPGYKDTKYGHGQLPIDHYKKDVDELVAPVYKCDWEALRTRLNLFGIYNATVMTGMPAETSAAVSNSTNGFNAPRSLVSVKGGFKQVVPEIQKLRNKYELLWDIQSPKGHLRNIAVWIKFMDQAISTDTMYNPNFFPDRKIPESVLMGDVLYAYKYGIPTLYYQNTEDDSGEIKVEDEVCDACTI